MKRSFPCLALLAFFVLAFGGCATRLPGDGVTPLQAERWHHHLARLERLDHWRFDGRIAVRSGARAWSARLDWHQRGERFEILIAAPMGQGAARLDGAPDGVVLELPGEAPRRAPSPEALLEAHTGVAVPLGGMRFWLVGRPEPATPAVMEWDEAGRLVRLEQGGWQVRYRRYGVVEGIDLPRRIDLWNERLRVRVVVDGWRLPARAGDERNRQTS